ncbi:vanadium-dependent haloperoxidase [Longimicrobium terrae]|uniref:Membrane-associated phospholipid phosphatase n=1 Tax=Longimicrobium terrae TaxID=1639882 RepID=A0A841GSW9_9BACT|nr:vanadium-dependent haloperoxidase [Longimicrobium terrae]MBB4635125.1 membrane-associated phospholipid phosphatase [Longimicrobium terrae]MBB6069519.1 membrane-associated phospholipid phosphatase [Longimicrobium terrae]NNC31679.1 vanadium-dependent haloperoxidase [Longimicrobium terrae]
MSCYDGKYPCPVPEYALKGPQVEPEASFWNHCPQLRMVSIKELLDITDNPGEPGYFYPYPDPCTPEGAELIAKEFKELQDLASRRDDPCSLVNPGECPVLTESPCKPLEKLPFYFGCRAPISRLLNLTPPALGAVQVNRLPGQQVIRTGRGLARLFENETPGLTYRHTLDYLITTRNWSPPRQALVWAALDVAIASALQAAWYYKWLSPRPLTSRRPRPSEYAADHGVKFNVLYDRPDELNPMYITCPDARPCSPNPGFSPGTPRHPAYPSGHSTYAGAASTILAYFFGNDPTPAALTLGMASTTIGEELRNMADNIGTARMWGGVHWRSDHEAGLRLGQVVACLVLRQLSSICGGNFNLCPPMPAMVSQCKCRDTDVCKDDAPPPCKDLMIGAEKCQAGCAPCGESNVDVQDPCKPPPPADLASPETLDARSVQQGAV